MTDHNTNPETGKSRDSSNPETRKRPGYSEGSTEQTNDSMQDTIQSMRRLLAYADDDPEGFEMLVNGETAHVDEQLVEDMQRVETAIHQ